MPTATLVDSQSLVRETIRKVSAIATLPEVTARIISTVEDPKSTAAQLHKIVSNDPALVTRILKVVNSAFYGLPGQVASIERAIVLLGLNAVKNIAVAASLGQLFRGVKLCEGFTAKDLWKHCVSVAVAARQLAREMRLPLGDEAFLAGMIHDVGTIVALQVFPEKFQAVCEQAASSDQPFWEIEREVIGADHTQFGAALTAHWKFPRTSQLVAGYHHQPMTLAEQNRILVTLVFVADTMCAGAKHGFPFTAHHQHVEDAGLVDLSLDTTAVQRVADALPALVESSAAIFS